MRKHTLILLMVSMVLVLVADVPSIINYQGKITDADGVGIEDDLTIQADLYDVLSGGSSLWNESHVDVNISNGLFSIRMGSINPIDIDFSGQLYLQLTIDGEAMVPRIALTSEAYALYANIADSLAGHSADEDDISDDNLGDLANVNTDAVASGQVLEWDGAEWIPANNDNEADDLGDNNLDDLADVDITGITIGQTIVWNGTSWEPGAASIEGAYNTDLFFNDGTNELSITDGDGSLVTTIDNEADDLSNNVLNDLNDVSIDTLNAGRVLVYNGTHWVPGDPSSATDNQIDSEVPTSSTGDFEFASSAINVHQAIDGIDEAIGNLDDGNPITTRISWYDLSSIPPGFADDADAVDYIATVNYSDGTDELVITDGGGAVSTIIDNEADDLTDNTLGDIGNVSESGVAAGNIIQYTATGWQAQNQTDAQVDLAMTGDFELIGGETDVHGALDYIDNALYGLSDSDTLTTAIKWDDIRSKPSCFEDGIDNVDDDDNDAENELISDIAWNEFTDELTITDAGGDNLIELNGFAQDDHIHENLIDGNGLVGGSYDGSTSLTWDVLPGRGLEISNDSIRLDDDYFHGNSYDARFIGVSDTAEGDIKGYFPDLTVRGIQGNPVTDAAPEFGSLMAWDGTEWNYTSASLMWGDSANFIKPLSTGTSDFKIYDEADSFIVRAIQSDEVSRGQWYGMKISREGFVSSKGYGIYSYAGAYADLGADTTVSEFWGVYAKAAYGKRNYGLYGIANDVGIDCLGYGVYGEGQTAGGYFYGPDNDGEVATLIIESGSQKMLIDGNEIQGNGNIHMQTLNDNSIVIGEIDGGDKAKLHLQGGFAIGSSESAVEEYALQNCIQLSTSTIGDGTGSFDNHTGALIYSDLDGTWGDGCINFHIAEGWRDYEEIPSFKIENHGLMINPTSTDLSLSSALTVYPVEDDNYCGRFQARGKGLIIYNDVNDEYAPIALYIKQYGYTASNRSEAAFIEIDGEDIVCSDGFTYPDKGIRAMEVWAHNGACKQRGMLVQSIDCGGDNYGIEVITDGSNNNTYGIYSTGQTEGSGGDAFGVYGYAIPSGSDDDGYGIYGNCDGNSGSGREIGVFATTGNPSYDFAAVFDGNVQINGTISKSSGSFLIDHPDDPYNKTLRHNFMESPENICFYRGKVVLDETGTAIADMPDYFKSLTKEDEASAQLTPIGRPFMTGCEFNEDHTKLIVYGDPGREVWWTVFADRDDPYINWVEPRMPIVQNKSDSPYCDEGQLLAPEAYGLQREDGYMHKRHHIENNRTDSNE